jgi:phage repressor protein C with HTH and peptisase S24 domain
MQIAFMALPDQEMARRLVRARKTKFEEAADAARALGIPEPTYYGHENGHRGFKGRAAEYARRFKVSLEWLLTGRGQMTDDRASKRTAYEVGYIGAGAEVVPIDDHAMGAGLEEVDIPPGVPDGSVVVIVRGDSMYPRLKDGERLFYMKQERNPSELLGVECVVKLDDGRMYVKELERGQNGLFNLLSHNAPPIRDQAVEWATPVLAILPRRSGR